MSAPEPIVLFAGPSVCGHCGQMRGAWVNEYGTTHCSDCPAFRKPPAVMTVSLADVIDMLPARLERGLPVVPQTESQMVAALTASLARLSR